MRSRICWGRSVVESDLLSKWLGGRGIAAKLLYDLVPKKTDPLSPENVLIISAGTLSGTNAPTAGRLCVTTVGAQTGVYLKTSAGGHFATSLRMVGYDYLVFHEASDHPVYVWLDRNGVQIRDATSLWGKGAREVTRRLSADQVGTLRTTSLLVSCQACSPSAVMTQIL